MKGLKATGTDTDQPPSCHEQAGLLFDRVPDIHVVSVEHEVNRLVSTLRNELRHCRLNLADFVESPEVTLCG